MLQTAFALRPSSAMLYRLGLMCSSALGLLTVSSLSSAQMYYGPSPYLTKLNSPFLQAGLPDLVIEDFEDGLFNTPGLTGKYNGSGVNLVVSGPGVFTDSVDGDDGHIDGLGQGGHELSGRPNVGTDSLGYTFSFDASVRGALPTYAGLVWTDGGNQPLVVEFFGPADELVGTISPGSSSSDGNFSGGTAEDRFFGAYSPSGISRFVIRSPGGGNNLTVDHLQFAGFPSVPEPASLAALGLGSLVLLRRRRDQPRKPL